MEFRMLRWKFLKKKHIILNSKNNYNLDQIKREDATPQFDIYIVSFQYLLEELVLLLVLHVWFSFLLNKRNTISYE